MTKEYFVTEQNNLDRIWKCLECMSKIGLIRSDDTPVSKSSASSLFDITIASIDDLVSSDHSATNNNTNIKETSIFDKTISKYSRKYTYPRHG